MINLGLVTGRVEWMGWVANMKGKDHDSGTIFQLMAGGNLRFVRISFFTLTRTICELPGSTWKL